MERIDHLMNLFEELVVDQGRLENLSGNIGNRELIETVEDISRTIMNMQNLILSMRMVPVEQVFNRFPRMVRGLARDLDKEINFQIIGAETELDRTVIDQIVDPLVHLIRNAVDHGIETLKKRKQHRKPSEGKLILKAFHSGNQVFIEVEDDGNGIDREQVINKLVSTGMITVEQSERLTDHEVNQFLLSSGFSTADHVTDVSRRGVGLDVVRENIESLGGHISIESEQGKGSKFTIQLPLNISILPVLLVNVQRETYGIPLSSIAETVLLTEEQMMSAHGTETMDFRGRVIPLVSLKEVFQVPACDQNHRKKYHTVVVVRKGDQFAGLVVEYFIGQQEVVLKSLGNYLQDIHAISGATLLGDSQVSLIIDPNALIK